MTNAKTIANLIYVLRDLNIIEIDMSWIQSSEKKTKRSIYDPMTWLHRSEQIVASKSILF